jgi:hypothetical protein
VRRQSTHERAAPVGPADGRVLSWSGGEIAGSWEKCGKREPPGAVLSAVGVNRRGGPARCGSKGSANVTYIERISWHWEASRRGECIPGSSFWRATHPGAKRSEKERSCHFGRSESRTPGCREMRSRQNASKASHPRVSRGSRSSRGVTGGATVVDPTDSFVMAHLPRSGCSLTTPNRHPVSGPLFSPKKQPLTITRLWPVSIPAPTRSLIPHRVEWHSALPRLALSLGCG